MGRVALTILSVFAFIGSACAARAAEPTSKLTYNRDIRPILSDNCFYCHGPDKNHRDGKFRLDERDSAIKKKAIVPGNVHESTLVERIFATDPDDIMPPPKTHKKLTAAQREKLKRWVAQGAEYEPFWAYVIPKRPPVPQVRDAKRAQNPIDAFILQKLEEVHLKPSPDADKRTLLRRLSLDLIGLPPTPQEVQAFLDDNSPNAYEKRVDRLLASPHFGERMAVPWLDAVRFADTVGFHGDQNQNVFPYRDYVIDAFNHDKPFDQFTIEQLAGDLLPHPTTEQLVATCFNRLNMMTREGGAQPKEYLAKYAADRVRTLSAAWLGSTMGCCECHDHKFDPFTTRDFYSMEAFWADVKQWGVYMDYQYTPNPDLKGFSNDHPFPPEIVVDSPYLHARQDRLVKQLDALAADDAARDAEAFNAWRDQTESFLNENPSGWIPLKTVPTTRPARSGNRSEFSLPAGSIAAIRVELRADTELKGGAKKARAAGTVMLSASIKSGKATRKLPVFYADADRKQERYSNGYAILGVQGGWRPDESDREDPQAAVYLLASPANAAEGEMLVVSLGQAAVTDVCVSISPLASLRPIDPDFVPSLRKNLGSSTDPLATRTYLLSSGVDSEILASARKIEQDVYECRDGKSPVLVTESVPPRPMRVLRRGNWQDEGGDPVVPATPRFLTHEPEPSDDHRLTRLDLARWIVSPDNPLTSRAVVNRLWKQFFGAGICASVEDMGAQGEMPSHPELLDWLAVEFRESGWDVKHMVKLMVMSSTYRQDSNLSPEAREIDPANRLLSAQSPRRLEAEFVRDNALAAAGLINLDIGGPSCFPYQPAGYYANIQFPDRSYVASPDERQYRRGVYMHWQRTFLHPMLANFDAPSREDAVCTRNLSNTPQQAMTLLNDPEFVEAARVLAEKAMAASNADDPRIEFAFRRALCRPAKQKERASLSVFLAEQRDYYKDHKADAEKLVHIGIAPVPDDTDVSEFAAWTTVCRVVLNLHETITRY
ncbi:MAG TPA: PSD1 and planctomycete cytochrome C domain-containing protein [Tepidisphaeraceae bacterium]